MRNKLIPVCLVLLLLLTVFPVSAATGEFDPDQKGSVSVSLVSPNPEQPVVGAELSVYYVATVSTDGQGNLYYSLSEDFDDGIALDDPDLVNRLDAIVSEQNIPHQMMVTDAEGNAALENLPLGLYFVKQTGEVKGFAPCTPFLVTLPLQTDGGFQYDVDASPKTSVARYVTVTVRKVWNVDKYATVPGSVTVQLLRGGEVLETAVLNKQNNWQMVYENMPASDAYSIKEVDVPKGYTATYAQKEYVLTVTNTASLIQTGQLVWPIPVFAMLGIVLLMAGFVILRKPGKDHA